MFCLMQEKNSLYLNVSWLNIQNVSLGGEPVEGQVWYSTAKRKGCLTIGQTHYMHRHLEKKRRRCMNA